MKFSKLWSRISASFGASVDAAVAEADKKVDIELHANRLLQQQKNSKQSLVDSRNKLITQKVGVEKEIAVKQERLTRIQNIIIADQDKDEASKSEAYKQQYLTAIHEGPLLVTSINLLKNSLETLTASIQKSVANTGKLDRNIMTIESQLRDIKIRNELANIKLNTYTVAEANTYFNLEKLEELVNDKEVRADSAEEIFNLDHGSIDDELSPSTDDFVKSVLKANKKAK